MNVRKLFGAVFFLGLGIALLIALVVLAFNLSATIGVIATVVIFALAFLVNSLMIRSENKMPGSFYNSKREEQEPKAHLNEERKQGS